VPLPAEEEHTAREERPNFREDGEWFDAEWKRSEEIEEGPSRANPAAGEFRAEAVGMPVLAEEEHTAPAEEEDGVV